MSHELRTPLNAVIGYSEMLLEDAEAEGGAEERTADLRRIHTAGRHLLALVNDVLDLSKIEAGRMEVAVATVELRGFLDEIAATMQPLIEANRNRLEISCAADIGEFVGDATKLRQILLNLVGNAAKFTRDGGVRLGAERERRADGEWIRVAVADTGIGMDAPTLAKLFSPFTQADANTAGKYGGTGLGLALSQRLARLMGGGIVAESESGRGSCFTLSLPARPAPPGSEPPSEASVGTVLDRLGLPTKLQLS
jgi:signal transduction histidine kinase